MRNWMKTVVAIGIIIIIVLIIILTMFIIYKISLDPIYNYISAIASLIVILLMLITIIFTDNSSNEYIKSVEESSTKHIKSVEDSTKQQIESWQRWDLIHRKQSIKSLIEEFKYNMEYYELIQKYSEKKESLSLFSNFILTSLEKSLYNSPIDDEKINNILLGLYYGIKMHDNKIITARTPGIPKIRIPELISSVAEEFEQKKEMFNKIIEMLEEYEQKLE
jgi:hypothetical protein